MPFNRSHALNLVPPNSVEAEEAIISSILLDNTVLDDVAEILDPGDFYKSVHQEIFAAFLRLYGRSEPIDLVTLTHCLEASGTLEKIGGATQLARIVDAAPLAVNAKHYAKIVSEKAFLRNMANQARRITARCLESEGNVDAVVDFVESSIFEELYHKNNTQYFSLKEIIDKSYSKLEKMEKRQYSGIPTGFGGLDALTSGFQKSDLIIIAARPSMGKTAFALNCTRNMSIKEGVPVAFFSFEMSKEQLGLRMLCSEARLSSYKLRDGFISKKEWDRLAKAAGILSDAPIFIDDSTDMTALDVRAKARRMKMKENIGAIIIDYLQLMEYRDPEARKVERRDLEIAQISRSLKKLAKELDIPVIALSQLNRMVEQRKDKRPMLSDLRESGALEQDADLVIFIHRDDMYPQDLKTDRHGMAEILLSKHRNGKTGHVELSFISENARFENLEYRHKDF